MYTKIINPKTGRKVSTKSKLGQNILRNYIKSLYYITVGGMPVMSSFTDTKALRAYIRGLPGAIPSASATKKVITVGTALDNIKKKYKNVRPTNSSVSWDDFKKIKTNIQIPSSSSVVNYYKFGDIPIETYLNATSSIFQKSPAQLLPSDGTHHPYKPLTDEDLIKEEIRDLLGLGA